MQVPDRARRERVQGGRAAHPLDAAAQARGAGHEPGAPGGPGEDPGGQPDLRGGGQPRGAADQHGLGQLTGY